MGGRRGFDCRFGDGLEVCREKVVNGKKFLGRGIVRRWFGFGGSCVRGVVGGGGVGRGI